MTLQALGWLLRARLYGSRRLFFYACACAALAAGLAPAGALVPLALGAALGIAAALDQTPGRHAHLDRCEQSAPLFGRELGRAKALVPCVTAVSAVAVYAAVQAARGLPHVGPSLWIAAAAAVAATLAALSATLRRGLARAMYVLVACAVGVAAYALGAGARSIAGETLFCAAAAYVALRQYGEALARYDPV